MLFPLLGDVLLHCQQNDIFSWVFFLFLEYCDIILSLHEWTCLLENLRVILPTTLLVCLLTLGFGMKLMCCNLMCTELVIAVQSWSCRTRETRVMTYWYLRIGELTQESLSFNHSLIEPEEVAITGHKASTGWVTVDTWGEKETI